MKLIDKDALVAEIEKLEELYCCYGNSDGMLIAKSVFDSIKNIINTLEVREVDLDGEVEKCLKQHQMLAVGKKDFTEIAKHFFELGLRASNPISAADRGTAEEIIINLKRVEQDYRINLTKEIDWLRNKVQKGE